MITFRLISLFEYTYASGFVADVTYPHNSTVYVGETFTKTWRVANLGSYHWENLYLQCTDVVAETCEPVDYSNYYLQPTSRRVLIPDTEVGGVADISVELKAPVHPCSVISNWQASNDKGLLENSCFRTLMCLVKVVSV